MKHTLTASHTHMHEQMTRSRASLTPSLITYTSIVVTLAIALVQHPSIDSIAASLQCSE